jgi:Zn-dependent M28 family amino/carboxypeptidase
VSADAASATITAEDVLRRTTALSDDRFEGRGPGTPGDTAARAWIAHELAQLGLQPAGAAGSWEQAFDIVSVSAGVPEAWTFRSQGDELSLERGTQFIAFSGVQESQAALDEAQLIFVGYGIEAPEYGWDDYKGVDVSGKVLLMLNNDPEWSDELFEGERRLYYGRWTYKYEMAAAKGASGAIIVHTTPSAGYPWQVVESSWSGPQSELPAAGEPRIQIGGWTTEAATRKLAELAGRDWDELLAAARSKDFAHIPLDVTTSLELAVDIERTQTANVLAVLPGSDPALAQEYVIYGAHHDHLGRGAADESGDDIYNGAFDNALGVAAQLGIARAYTQLERAPRRSILFAFWGGEEQGLLGSGYFAANPTVAAGRIAANMNLDGGNIWGATKDVVFVGRGKSSLDAVLEGYAAQQGRTVKPDQFPDRGFFYRSDQFSLAKIGVPAIYLDSGNDFVDRPAGWGREQIEAYENERYHQPSDEIDDTWLLDGLLDDTKLLFLCGLHVAEADALPTWNPGDEFEAARQSARVALE